MLNFERVRNMSSIPLDESFAGIFEEMLSYDEGTFADAARLVFYSDKSASALLEDNGFKPNVARKLTEHYHDRILLLAKAGDASLFQLNIRLTRALIEAGIYSKDELERIMNLCGGYLPPLDGVGKDARTKLYAFLDREEPRWSFPCYVMRVGDNFYHNKTNQWRKTPCEISSIRELSTVIGHCYHTSTAVKIVQSDAIRLKLLVEVEGIPVEFYGRMWPLLQEYIPCRECSHITEYLTYPNKAAFYEKSGVSPSYFSTSVTWLRKWVKLLHTHEYLVDLLPLGKSLIQVLLHYDITDLKAVSGMLEKCGGLFPAFPGRYRDYDKVYSLLGIPVPEFNDFPYVVKLANEDKYYGNHSRFTPDIMGFVSSDKAVLYETLKSLRVAVLNCYLQGASVQIVSRKDEDNS